MGSYLGKMGMSGTLTAKKIKGGVVKPSLKWRLKQAFRMDTIKGIVSEKLAKLLSKYTHIITVRGTLKAVHIDGRTGTRTDYGIVSRRLVTTAWVQFLVDQLQAETTEIGDLKYHDSGVGVTAAAVGDTDIETTDGEARATGNQGEGATADIYQTVGTITYTTTKAITEHGIFTQVTGGTMADRHTFSAINVDNTDQIEFTYEMTIDDGG